MIAKEAERCLNCNIPKCVEGCPINNRIPEFISKIKDNDYKEAYKIIHSVSPLGAICGRICPHEKQCQGNCVRGIKEQPISIGTLESFVCDWARENNIKINYDIVENNIKVAIVGAGPSGIACAVDLRKLGYDVTIYEKEKFLGGILMYGIPEYRLPKDIVIDVASDLLNMGIKIKLNTVLIDSLQNEEIKKEENEDKELISIEALFEAGFKAIFLGIGSEKSNILSIEGINLSGVIGANEFLKNKRECKNKKIIVIGGGNVAMDAARVAKKEGAEVTIIYRRSKEDMPANKTEIEEAEKEGVQFIFKTNVTKINSKDGFSISNIESDTGKIIETDYVVMAIGSTPNKKYLDEKFTLTEQDLVEIKDNYETSIPNVFAGGDLVQKKATVCMAIKNGKDAAKQIDKKIGKGINRQINN